MHVRTAMLRREPQSQLGLFRDLFTQRPLPSAPLGPNNPSQIPLYPGCFRTLSLPKTWATPRACPFQGLLLQPFLASLLCAHICPMFLVPDVLALSPAPLLMHDLPHPGRSSVPISTRQIPTCLARPSLKSASS